MRREQVEHVLRAAAAVTNQDDFVVIGSQAIFGSVASPPPELVASVEVDLVPREQPERAIEIDGAIGDGSMFHDTFGYYGHGVGLDTAVAPDGWLDRLVPLTNENTRGATGWCMEPHDLVVAKLAAGREKDIDFARVALDAGIVDERLLRERIDTVPVEESHRARIHELLTLASTARNGD